MIFYGVLLLVIAIICWALSKYNIGNPITGVAGLICGGIGLLLIVVGILIALSAGTAIEIGAHRMTVDVYTVENCQPCKLTKQALDKSDITYSESDLDTIRDEAVAQGIMSAPVVVIDGKLAWGGFRPDRIKALIA